MIQTLSNGIRVAISRNTGNVTYTGVLVDAGTRDEPTAHPGLAHFVEHTLFKGTTKRSSWHISNRMESIGGELNAYTNKEGTSVYTISPAGYEERGIELIADLISNASFPSNELEKEREVIIEEINSYLDNPAEAIFDRFEDEIYKGSNLAHNILGTPESVREISGEDCRGFVGKYYNPANIVGFISSPADPEKMLRLMEKHWGKLDRRGEKPHRETPPPIEPFNIVEDDNGHQAHTLYGARIFPRTDSRRFALMLLNNYLGGPCMNSRLNQQLREKRGLVYTVDSFSALLSDTGVMMVYFGADRHSVEKCIRLIKNEFDSLAQNRLSANKLNKIKEQYCGQLLISSDNREAMAMSLGKNLMFYGKLPDIPALAARLREVTAEEIREVAELMQPERCSRITLM